VRGKKKGSGGGVVGGRGGGERGRRIEGGGGEGGGGRREGGGWGGGDGWGGGGGGGNTFIEPRLYRKGTLRDQALKHKKEDFSYHSARQSKEAGLGSEQEKNCTLPNKGKNNLQLREIYSELQLQVYQGGGRKENKEKGIHFC